MQINILMLLLSLMTVNISVLTKVSNITYTRSSQTFALIRDLSYPLWSIVNCRKFSINLYRLHHLQRNLNPLNPGSTKYIFWKFERNCLSKLCLGPSLEESKSQFCHAPAKKCFVSGNCLIWSWNPDKHSKFPKD